MSRTASGGRARRRAVATAAPVAPAVLLALVVAWWRGSAPVGHVTSAEARDRFAAACTAAMGELPRPDATLDVRTGSGVVRMYRFDGPDGPGDAGRAPLVLLPGRAAASPLWADGLPALRALRTVYIVDLLGEPGAGVQDRPIRDAAEQARWLDEALAALPGGRGDALRDPRRPGGLRDRRPAGPPRAVALARSTRRAGENAHGELDRPR